MHEQSSLFRWPHFLKYQSRWPIVSFDIKTSRFAQFAKFTSETSSISASEIDVFPITSFPELGNRTLIPILLCCFIPRRLYLPRNIAPSKFPFSFPFSFWYLFTFAIQIGHSCTKRQVLPHSEKSHFPFLAYLEIPFRAYLEIAFPFSRIIGKWGGVGGGIKPPFRAYLEIP